MDGTLFHMDRPSFGEKLRLFRLEEGWTQQEAASLLGIKRSRYANFEINQSFPNDLILRRLASLGFDGGESPLRRALGDVGPPLAVASQLQTQVAYLGRVAASDPPNWTDPLESETFELVPPEMGDGRGRFACRIGSDSMSPLLEPDDLCVFHRTESAQHGHVVLFRSDDMLVTVKWLTQAGQEFMLRPLNSRYTPTVARGTALGYLVGIVREQGTRRTTVYDHTGIRP